MSKSYDEAVKVWGAKKLSQHYGVSADHFKDVRVDFEVKDGWEGDSLAESATCLLSITARIAKDFDGIEPSRSWGLPGKSVSRKAGGWVSIDEDFLYSHSLSELIGEVLAAGEDD